MVAYSKAFKFVEVNSTFYSLPLLEDVERWRRLVPPDFKFSVRAHRSLTQTKFKPTRQTFEVFEQLKLICQTLKSDILHLQTPARFNFDHEAINSLNQLLPSLNLGSLRLALEIRGATREKLPVELVTVMQRNNMIHCIDLSKGEIPAYDSDTLYTRLFGKGRHNVYQPTDAELAEIDCRALNSNSQKIAMSFHFVRMYKDAARLKTYKHTRKFPMVTRSTGISSLEEVLQEDARFPSSKQELIRNQGWKLFDSTSTERKHVRVALSQIPDGTYNSLPELIGRLKLKWGDIND